MNITVKKSKGFKGKIQVPGDKSISHRAAFIAALASGESEITNYLLAQDCLATLRCLQKLGVEVHRKGDKRLIIKGRSLFGFKEPETFLDAENSGTTARFLLGILAGQNFFSVIDGDSSLQKRPMKRVVEPLRKMSALIEGRNEGNNLPIAIKGSKLEGIRYKIPIPSAQLKSALIFAGLLAEGFTEVEEVVPSRDHTERLLRYLGAPIKKDNNKIRIRGNKEFNAKKIIIPGDISSACFFITAAILVGDSKIILPNIGINPTRTGFLNYLNKMGGRINISDQKNAYGEPMGTITVSSSSLKGITIQAHDIPILIDEISLIALLATQAEGTTVISGASELRVKESDRLKTIADNFRKMGVRLKEKEDGLIIEGPQKLKGAVVQSWGDHRIAMTMAIAGLIAEGKTEIVDFDCYKISFPNFYALLKEWQNE